MINILGVCAQLPLTTLITLSEDVPQNGYYMFIIKISETESYMLSQTDYTSWWRHQIEIFSALLAFFNSPHKGQWRGALKFSLIWAWINAWVNNHKAGDLRRHCAYYDITVIY